MPTMADVGLSHGGSERLVVSCYPILGREPQKPDRCLSAYVLMCDGSRLIGGARAPPWSAESLRLVVSIPVARWQRSKKYLIIHKLFYVIGASAFFWPDRACFWRRSRCVAVRLDG